MDNRQAILAHALDLFASRGYDAVGVQAICTAAGITKPTLYHYFGSKQGLLAALVEERIAPLLAQLAEVTTYRGDLPHTLTQLVHIYFGFARTEPVVYRLMLGLWFGPTTGEAFQIIVACIQEQHRLVEELFAWATADHGNMRGRQRIYAATLLGTINIRVTMALNGFGDLDDTVVYQTVHQFSHGIYS
ncbi:TetR/AcrR family transcriptional regulator [Candidatus Chloroploca asiatica]|uniref:TetR family transcriptional regulator n=1 Tax=Candidatus Chloroploca asiatica TaxID=1506545 RepID=A0A2H3KQP3_9CHLR|nr:TetR/AcrR family transcriptional regulator [Candidatus Chloroploca asiatica]PDW00731.1 TetR family transcriptional regulator [Candidatus Chloroploca asiatica]